MQIVKAKKPYSKSGFGVIIVFAFLIILLTLILTPVGGLLVNKMIEVGHSIPFINQLLPDPEVAPSTNLDGSTDSIELIQLKQDIKERDQLIKSLQSQIDEKNTLLALLDGEQGLEPIQETRISEEERKKQLSNLAEMYASMTASNAAPIVSSLSLKESSLILSYMDSDEQGLILSKMEPKLAADISILLKDQKMSDNDEIAALQERINMLVEELSVAQSTNPSISDFGATFNSMPAEEAADVLVELYSRDEEKTVLILSEVSVNQRSQILANMEPEDAATILQSLPNE